MKLNWAWNNVFQSVEAFSATSNIIGHETSHLILRGNTNLYSGVRKKIVIFKNQYLFLNYLKKSNFLKKLYSVGINACFTTARLEFFPLIKTYAGDCGATPVQYNRFMDLTAAEKLFFQKGISADPVFFLFNNDNLVSRGITKEINLKNYFTVSVADSNSLNTGAGGYIPLYGSDDSLSSLHFYGKLIRNCANKPRVKKKNICPSRGWKKKKSIINDNDEFIVKKLKKIEVALKK